MKEIGINFELDSRAQSEFTKVIGNREYDVSILIRRGSEPTSAAEYFYHSKNWNGVGTPEIDALSMRWSPSSTTLSVLRSATKLRRST